jgi:hypothetical protein
MVNRSVRALLTVGALMVPTIPLEPSAAAEGAASSEDGNPRPSSRLIERAPGVEPTTAPLEFGFALLDWLLG